MSREGYIVGKADKNTRFAHTRVSNQHQFEEVVVVSALRVHLNLIINAIMDPREEQRDEVEALESIFVDEFELLHNSPFRFELTVHTDREEEDLNFIVVKLVVEFPEEYP